MGILWEKYDYLRSWRGRKKQELTTTVFRPGQQLLVFRYKEISLLRQFRHKNIVRYLGTDKDDAQLYIFLELVTKASLASLYQKYRLRDSQVSVYTRQILSGLNYLHCRDVVHRQLSKTVRFNVLKVVPSGSSGLGKKAFTGA